MWKMKRNKIAQIASTALTCMLDHHMVIISWYGHHMVLISSQVFISSYDHNMIIWSSHHNMTIISLYMVPISSYGRHIIIWSSYHHMIISSNFPIASTCLTNLAISGDKSEKGDFDNHQPPTWVDSGRSSSAWACNWSSWRPAMSFSLTTRSAKEPGTWSWRQKRSNALRKYLTNLGEIRSFEVIIRIGMPMSQEPAKLKDKQSFTQIFSRCWFLVHSGTGWDLQHNSIYKSSSINRRKAASLLLMLAFWSTSANLHDMHFH